MVVTGRKIEDGVFLNLQDLTEFTIKCNPLKVFQTECPEAPLFLQSSTGQMVIVCPEFFCYQVLNRCS